MRFCDLGPLEVEVDSERVTARGARLNAVLETHILRLRRLPEPSRGRGQAASVLVNDAGARLTAIRAQPQERRIDAMLGVDRPEL
ncbi:MAG TPA: hypothetical protein VM428_01400 [Microlunatus sp.]|nr:hypothetical protein [Microlunatus sp.]